MPDVDRSPNSDLCICRHTPVCTTLALASTGLLAKVRAFTAFTPDNDPHGKHDFGAIVHGGTRYFWTIDTYDLQLQMRSSAAADPTVTKRVLTMMRADEYGRAPRTALRGGSRHFLKWQAFDVVANIDDGITNASVVLDDDRLLSQFQPASRR